MEKKAEIHTDHQVCNQSFATATGLSAILDGALSHHQSHYKLANT
ncbi:hypothetical protein [Methylovulum psychrotolerans]|jgi:hypothetical protein|nr:hypothetical protein [Methylovulum psychrotolerans]